MQQPKVNGYKDRQYHKDIATLQQNRSPDNDPVLAQLLAKGPPSGRSRPRLTPYEYGRMGAQKRWQGHTKQTREQRLERARHIAFLKSMEPKYYD